MGTRPVVFGSHLPLRVDDAKLKEVERVQADVARDRSYTVRYLLDLGLAQHRARMQKRAADRAYQARKRSTGRV